ncbi:MAG: hypothetical protein AB7O96_17845, partial [Pseudobdellovibrionaceae bacterium]
MNSEVFDCNSYLSSYSDLCDLSWTCTEAQSHWLQFGIAERSVQPLHSPLLSNYDNLATAAYATDPNISR